MALGTALIAAGMLGVSLTIAASGPDVDEQDLAAAAQEQSEAHAQMHQLMDMR